MISLFKVNPRTKTDARLCSLYSKSLEKWRRARYSIFGSAYAQVLAYGEELDRRNIDVDLVISEEGLARWEGRPMDISKCKVLPEVKEARNLFEQYSRVVSEDSHPLVEKVRDVSTLPAPKMEIASAILLLLQDDVKKYSSDILIERYLSLCEFQPDVGEKPIVTDIYGPVDDDDPEIPSELEDFAPSKDSRAWQRILNLEFAKLRAELVSAGYQA